MQHPFQPAPSLLSAAYASSSGENRHVVNVIAKRSYRIQPGARCTLAAAQTPIVIEPEYHHHPGQGGDSAPSSDPDVFCHNKTGTDLVVQGNAYSLRGPVASMTVAVAVAPEGGSMEAARASARKLRVIGDRRVLTREGRAVAFSEPLPFTSMPLRYDRAYGGRDIWSDEAQPDKMAHWFVDYSPHQFEELTHYVYPRNPAGRGYLVHPSTAAFEALMLPNIEHPQRLLTPDELCSDDPLAWHRAPLPGGFDWVEQSWFPRVAFIGGCQPYAGDAEDLPEVASGYLHRDYVAEGGAAPFLVASQNLQFFHGASAGLVLPLLRGDETIVVSGMHPQLAELAVVLPDETPRMVVEVFGEAKELTAALRTVLLRLEESVVDVVWAAQHPIDKPLTPQQLEQLRHAVEWNQ